MSDVVIFSKHLKTKKQSFADDNYFKSDMIFDLFGRPAYMSSNKIILFRNSKGNFYKKFIVE